MTDVDSARKTGRHTTGVKTIEPYGALFASLLVDSRSGHCAIPVATTRPARQFMAAMDVTCRTARQLDSTWRFPDGQTTQQWRTMAPPWPKITDASLRVATGGRSWRNVNLTGRTDNAIEPATD